MPGRGRQEALVVGIAAHDPIEDDHVGRPTPPGRRRCRGGAAPPGPRGLLPGGARAPPPRTPVRARGSRRARRRASAARSGSRRRPPPTSSTVAPSIPRCSRNSTMRRAVRSRPRLRYRGRQRRAKRGLKNRSQPRGLQQLTRRSVVGGRPDLDDRGGDDDQPDDGGGVMRSLDQAERDTADRWDDERGSGRDRRCRHNPSERAEHGGLASPVEV